MNQLETQSVVRKLLIPNELIPDIPQIALDILDESEDRLIEEFLYSLACNSPYEDVYTTLTSTYVDSEGYDRTSRMGQHLGVGEYTQEFAVIEILDVYSKYFTNNYEFVKTLSNWPKGYILELLEIELLNKDTSMIKIHFEKQNSDEQYIGNDLNYLERKPTLVVPKLHKGIYNV